MTAPLFITTEKKSGLLPLLIIDKPGHLSRGLVSQLSEHFTTILATEQKQLPHLKRVVHVPYRRSMPVIPDNYFSAIIVFYHGEHALADSTRALIKKAKQNNAKLLFITSMKLSHTPFLNKAVSEYHGAHLLVYGDVFGLSPEEDSVISYMTHEARHKGNITVSGSGLREVYPVYYADVLQGVLTVLLSQHPPRVGLLLPSHPTAEIHLARLVKNLYPHAELQFDNRRDGVGEDGPVPEGVSLLQEPYPLAEKLKYAKIHVSDGHIPSRHQPRRKPRFQNKRVLQFLLLIAGISVLFSTLTFLFFFIGLLSLNVTLSAVKSGNLPLAVKRAETAQHLFRLSETSAGGVTALFPSLGLGRTADQYTAAVRAGKTASEVAYYLADAGVTYGPIARGQGGNPGEGMIRISTDLKHAVLGLAKLRTEKLIPPKYKTALAAIEAPLNQVSGVIDVLPQLAGVGNEQTYVVLFQNNMELRPGGGFIGSYGLLTLEDGRIASFTIHDVYDADGQLIGHIEPPFALKRYLGASHWFLRDSNFSVEFSENAAQAASFLHLSTQESVDGVITMDVSFLRALLHKIGPVYLPAYDETVSAKNFYLKAQTHAEEDFFPGSTQKKDFLQHVAQALLLSLQERESLPLLSVLQTFQQAVSEKHLMLASADPRVMTLLVKNGYAPTVTKSKSENEAAVSDFIGYFDANVGANKANYYITRRFEHSVLLKPTGAVQGSLAVSYKNESTSESPFGGDYKNYAQLVLPQEAVVTGILLDDVEQEIVLPVTSERVYRSDRFVPSTGIELDRQTIHGRSVSGFYVVVPKGKEKVVTIRYLIPAVQELPERFEYVMRLFKQPGTDYDSYRLHFSFDPTLTLLSKPDFVSQAGNTLEVSRELAEDIKIPLVFVKP